MQLILHNIKISLEEDSFSAYKILAAKKLGMPETGVQEIRILKKSLDARDKRQFYYNLSLVATVSKRYKNKKNFPQLNEKPSKKEIINTLKERPVIVGFGPAGIFAALTFLEYGIKPIIFERGKKVEQRIKDIRDFENSKIFNPESNAQFGEGGAGTYSDGKLITRIKESGYVAKVLETFIRFGASEEIAYFNKPHLGTDQLCKIIKRIREFIVQSGGEIHFQAKVTNLIIENDSLKGVEVNGQQKCLSPTIVFAIGHSARDTLQMLSAKGVGLEAKPFALGVRIEHPAELINLMQYGEKYKDNQKIGPADYSLAHGGVFSFCMCPGGEIVNASSENGGLALNGMSNSQRNGQFSNSAIVAAVSVDDFGSSHPLAGIELQKEIEVKAYKNWSAPAQNLLDYLNAIQSQKIRPNSYKMGTVSTELNQLLPGFVTNKLIEAFKYWQQRLPMFVSDQAVLMAPETRTSSPVRILRSEKREAINLAGFYPVGEGAGYAGGITSSAVDAIKTVEAILGIL
ncbi:MAG: dehydrogenase [Candidatus Margulisbacteria bacterium]|nr:dehydrogenase [Candidatus Margulisiibacteriota bacterium]